VRGHLLTPGYFLGRAIYVAGPSDLPRLRAGDLAFLENCPKAVAFEALGIASSAVNLTRSMTQHLTHGRDGAQPYAVALSWPEGFPADGEKVELQIIPPPPRPKRPPLPDIPPIPVRDHGECGGKAAGLILLEREGFSVPPFVPISNALLAEWEESGEFEERARYGLQGLLGNPLPVGPWAVRSSADIEDAEGRPLSGTFGSDLGVASDDLAAALRRVRASAAGPEVDARRRTGGLDEEPRMSVVVQRMVRGPRLAGTVFIPAPCDPGCLLIDCMLGGFAGALMDGSAQPDLSVLHDGEGLQVSVEVGSLPDKVTGDLLTRVAREALTIYQKTGRGDLEFAVDPEGCPWWLQARMLNAAVESVDRRGFAQASRAYYCRLAFEVHIANRTPPTFFRCFDLADGRFGYSVGIRHRDRIFHECLLKDSAHLGRVTRFGWETEIRMRGIAGSLGARNPNEVLDALVLHGAVQLPFSIPMAGSAMDRYRSDPVDEPPEEGLLEGFLSCVLARLSVPVDVSVVRDLLRQPLRTFSASHATEVLFGLLRRDAPPALADVIEYHAGEWRDLPDLGSEGAAGLVAALSLAVDERRMKDPTGALLEQELAELERTRIAREFRRREFLGAALRGLPSVEWRLLEAWARYLRMKAETNETHALYRGRCFAWFARVGFAPSEGCVRRKCAEALVTFP
jgi:hypothetical protein